MMQSPDWQRFAWLGVCGQVPAAWDVARHSVKPHKGTLGFVDRRRQRLQLTWTTCKSPPAIDRMLDDHRQRQISLDEEASFASLNVPGWRGLRRTELGDAGSTEITRAVRYFNAFGRLLEAVVLHDDEPDARAEAEAVVASLSVESAGDEPGPVRLFGMDVQAGKPWRLRSVSVSAGEASLQYGDRGPEHKHGPKAEARVRRRGMASTWYRGDPGKALEDELKDAEPRVLLGQASGRTAARAESLEPGTRIERWMGRRRLRRDVLWHAEEHNAVMQLTTWSPPKSEYLPDDIKVQALGVTA